jgi:predicted secreted protein
MSLLTIAAIYFILWWTVLFIVLPLGFRSQGDEGEITNGTIESAPAKFRGGRVVLLTTVISAALFAVYHIASSYLGLGITDLPNIIPSYNRG